MRRFLVSCLAIATASIGMMATQASAAPGDVTSTPFTAPASVAGQTLMTSFSDSAGGSYQVYRSGQVLTMIRVKQDGSVDSTFGGSGTVSIAVPSQLQSSGTMRASGVTNPKTATWWVVVGATGQSSLTDTVEVALTSGALAGANRITNTVTAASILNQCKAIVPDTTKYQTPMSYTRRNGGLWLQATCATELDLNASRIFIPLSATGDADTSATAFFSKANLGGSATCAGSVAVGDPTSAESAPELWIVQTEFTLSSCSSPTAASINAVATLAVKSDGTVTRTQLTTSPRIASSIRIDPGGRPVLLATDAADTTKIYMSRLKTDGSLDTSVGDAGFLLLDTGALPAGAVRISAGLLGVVTTADTVYFVIAIGDNENATRCDSTTLRTYGFRMALVSPAKGFATTYGTGGIGQRVTTVRPENINCVGGLIATGSSVDSSGRPVIFTASDAGMTYNVWSAIAGATGGGEGGTGLGGFTRDTGGAPSAGSGSAAGRVDTKVYTKLPTKTEIYTAFFGLSAKQARTLTMSSNTPNTCVVVGRHVALVGIGQCEVNVLNKTTRAQVRTLRTTVSAATAKAAATSTSESGTAMVPSDPILFRKSTANISKTARGQIRELKDAANNSNGVVVVGHAAALTDASNFSLSRNRARNVSNVMKRLKVRKPIVVVAKGTTEQISKRKTEKAQAQNRRVVVYVIPSS